MRRHRRRQPGLPAAPCSGNCKLGVNEDACTPRLAHWRDAALTLAALEGGQPLDLAGLECSRPAKDIDINTTFAGARRGPPFQPSSRLLWPQERLGVTGIKNPALLSQRDTFTPTHPTPAHSQPS